MGFRSGQPGDGGQQAMLDADLDAALVAWAREYGPGAAVQLGYPSQSISQKIIDYAGHSPDRGPYVRAPVRTQADEVDALVREMGRVGLHVAESVITVDSFRPHWAMDQRLRALRVVGVEIGRTGYYDALRVARAYLLGAMGRRKAG